MMAKNLLLLASALAASCALAQEQIHLTMTGDNTEMIVEWVEIGGSCSDAGSVTFASSRGLKQSSLGLRGAPVTVKATSTLYSDGMSVPICLWQATMSPLTPNAAYTYVVENGGSKGPSYTFTAAPNDQRRGGKIYAVYSDLGLNNSETLPAITAEAEAGVFDTVLMSGDLAYDLGTSGGERGNEFMRLLGE